MIDLKEAGSAGSKNRIKDMVNRLRENRSARLGEKAEAKEGEAIRAGFDYDKAVLEEDASVKKDRKATDKALATLEKKTVKKEKVEDKKAKVDRKIAKYKESK